MSFYLWHSEQIGESHSVEVSCGPHYYMTTEGFCEKCDFRCLSCNGPENHSCTSCDLKKKGVIIDSSRCDCESGYIANTRLEECVPSINYKDKKRRFMEENYKRIMSPECRAGKTFVVLNELSSVTVCPEGTYKDNNDCKGCLPGSYSGEGQIECTKCPQGTYNPSACSKSVSFCQSCEAGTFNSGIGASVCTECSAGTYSSGGAAGCTNCLPGTYSSGGASTCTNGPAGTSSFGGVIGSAHV